jgi:pimeloyl-ACP methyl ester carboxylesterase
MSKKPNWKLRLGLLAVASFLVLGVPLLAFVGSMVATAMPTDIEALSARYEPIEERSGRVPREGCGLNERASGSGCVPLRELRYDEAEVTFPSSHPERGLRTFRGTLGTPRVEGRRPAAILIHGSGPNCRDQEVRGDLLTHFSPALPMFRELARELTAQGIVVLRYDKRHCHDYEDADHDPATFEWSFLTDDARDALDFLALREEVDPEALIVIGHSEGAQLAPFVGHDDPRVAAVVMLAGPTGRFADGLLGQLELFAALRREQYDYFTAYMLDRQIADIRSCTSQLERPGYDPEEQCLGGGVTLRALASFHAYEDRTPEILRTLHCPLLALQGSADINIDPGEIPRIRRIVAGRDAEVHRIPGVSHVMTNAITPPDPMELDPRVLDVLSRFFASVKRP